MKIANVHRTAWLVPGLVMTVSGGLITASCAQDEPPTSATDSRREATMEMRKKSFEDKNLERVVVDNDNDTAVTGEIPDAMLAKVYAELESLTGGRRADFELQRAEQVQWSDGGMGCAERGAVYTQAPVDGYWVVLKYEGKDYDYRGNNSGYFRLCTGPLLPGRSGPRQ